DVLVELGFEPIVELNPMPSAIASGDQTFFGYKMNVTPPREWKLWEELCGAVARHFVERYGLQRVRNWLFEVWNEPNLNRHFWTGTEEEYYQLYASAARGIKGVDRQLRVGGPASAGTEMALPFVRWCRKEGVPLDFVSTHNYPMNEYGKWPRREGSPHPPGMAMVEEFRVCREALDAEGFGHLPNVVTEWNTLHCDEEGRAKWVGCKDCSRLFSAAAALHYAVAIDPYVEVFSYWTLNDSMEEAGVTAEPFGPRNQYYGLMTIDGLPKAAFHAFKYLGRMEGPRWNWVPEDKPALAGSLITDECVTTRALLWNFHEPLSCSQEWKGFLPIPIKDELIQNGKVLVITVLLSRGVGSVYETWEAMGGPVTLTRIEREALAAAAQPRHYLHWLEVREGIAKLPFVLQRDEVLFAEVCPPRIGSALGKEICDAALDVLNRALQYPGAVVF
ncbi:MAG: hypothetical protein NZL93_03545, partial [Chthoniobacterales bacterium]|nr:hypothetical protein [Chthoniobacterales bacterium]